MGLTPDVVVVGSGAAGGWAARTLAEAGLSVLVLEAGPLLAGDQRVDRVAHVADRQPVQSRSTAYEPANSHLFVDDLDNPYSTGSPYDWFRGRQVGGRLHLWAGVCLRMSDRELSGDGDDGRRWPIGYRDLAPYYDRVEEFMRVSCGGEISPAAPQGPVVRTPRALTRGEQRLARAVAGGFPDRQVLTGRIATAAVGDVLAAALATGRVQLRPDAVVSALELDDAGKRATGVVFVDRRTGVTNRVQAGAVMLCASAFESVRILLNTRTPQHPDGLGGRTGQLGRYLLDHTAGVLVQGVVPGLGSPRPADGPGFVPVCHVVDAEPPSREFRGSYGITAFAPEVMPLSLGSAQWASASGGQPFRMWTSGEVQPRAENRLTLDTASDAWGIPRAHITLRYGADEAAMAADQLAVMTRLADAAGFEITEASATLLTPGSSVHEMGGAAMGSDADSSVLDQQNRVWDAPNVVVADGACFPRAGWQNPTLTVMAVAARAAELLAAGRRSGTP